MRKNRATHLLAPTVLAETGNADKRMAFGGAAFEIRMPLVIHVMQQSDGFPQICVFAAQLREMLHRVGNRIAVFPEAFGLHPVVQGNLGASGERFTHRSILWIETL